jgi:hypothetical protein
MVSGIVMPSGSLEYFFHLPIASLRDRITGAAPEGAAETCRSNNKTRRTTSYLPLTEEPEPNLFELVHRGFVAPVVEEEDVDHNPDGYPLCYEPTSDIDSIVTAIYRRFVVDVIQRSPNPKGAHKPSYCTIAVVDRASVQETVFKNPVLSDIFMACSYKIASESQWDTVFDNFWPDKSYAPPLRKTQNYSQCEYHSSWINFIQDLDNRTVEGIRAQIKVKFSDYFWIPHAQTDRIWSTKVTSGFTRLGAAGDECKAAPRLLVRLIAPIWVPVS